MVDTFFTFATQRIKLLCIILQFLLAVPVSASGWWQETTAPSTLTAQALVKAFEIVDGNGRPVTSDLVDVDGRKVLVSGKDGLKLTGPSYGPDCEITIRFGMNSPVGTKATLAAGLGNALPVSVNAVGGSGELDCDAAGIRCTHKLRGVYQRSLNYPDQLRKLLDHQMSSSAELTERWLSVRYVLRKQKCEVYINDILANTISSADGKLRNQGALQLTLSPNVQLLSITSCPLPSDPLFETVRIDSRLNGAKIDDEIISGDALPKPNAFTAVKDIPFVFPEPDRLGNDHIDLEGSWLQNSFMEGDFEPQAGLIGGRWVGPLTENPTRIQFQVPKGPFRALHLICASDSENDSVPIVTAQFFNAGMGRPESFSSRVPLLTAKSSESIPLPVKLNNGKLANLYLVTIPIDMGSLAVFDQMECYDLEITKEVQYYRCYPDPSQYSVHAAGLPSAVHVYAMTLERPAVSVDLQSDATGHVWEAPDSPSYTVKLRNITSNARNVTLKLTTQDYYGKEKTAQSVSVDVPAGAEVTRKFSIKLQRYGYHDVALTQVDGGKVWVEKRSLAYLHPDTRERGDWQSGRGPIFGYWMSVGHGAPEPDQQMLVMSMAGAEAANRAYFPPNKLAEKLKMTSFNVSAAEHWKTKELLNYLDKPEEEAEDYLLKVLRTDEATLSAFSRKDILTFFAEPSLGPITSGIPPDYYGVDYELSPNEQDALDRHMKAFLIGARIVKKYWPDARCLLPWGDPIFPVYFLRASEEVRELAGGVAVDIPAFERMAETQMHVLAIHRCYVMREEFRKAGVKDPVFAMVEGPAVSTHPSSLTLKEHADNWVRLDLLLYAHGIDRLLGGWGFECASYYGEQHYGSGGLFDRTPLFTPRPAYSALAAMSRHVNRKNLDKWLPTGSLSVYALQFKHYRTGEMTHIFWTIRGKRPVTLAVPQGATVTLYDQMDNPTTLQVKNGKVTFTIDQSPVYIEGLTGNPTIALGKPDHSDSKPAPAVVKAKQSPQTWSMSTFPLMSPSSRPPVPQMSRKLVNLGDGSWKLSDAEDLTYANNNYLVIARFPGKMSASVAKAPNAQGGSAIAVHFGKQDKERLTMPYYTTIEPAKPIVIPGKASHIGLWAKASSDWGRVVYCLRDAEGERWISIGARNDWNCDDTLSASFFCFDGWRYLRFEMPANSPHDQYRELGSTWWGHFEKGDGKVNLPLKLEKIIVERRSHAMYVNDPQPTRPDDVLLGDLYAEYGRAEDCTEEAIRLNRLRMPVPDGMPELDNPIIEIEKTGVGKPTVVTKITLPSQESDGTRCYVHFDTVAGAGSYDVWVSPYSDGLGAIKLGSGWKSPGQLITGLRQDTDFYVFVTYTDNNGKSSKPSKPLKIRLEDVFGMK